MFPKGEIKRIPDGKHIFSHVEWHMRCYEVLLEEEIRKEQIEIETGFFTKQEIEEKISLPSAFDCCKKFL